MVTGWCVLSYYRIWTSTKTSFAAIFRFVTHSFFLRREEPAKLPSVGFQSVMSSCPSEFGIAGSKGVS